MYIDKEFALLETLSENEETSQRQLSKVLGISLGSVNMLINKMQKDGWIKIKNISANTIAYMLTPEGIAEKANKTYHYITYHYKRINDTKEKIKKYLGRKMELEKSICIVLDESEISQIILTAVSEINNGDKVKFIFKKKKDEKTEIDENALLLLLTNYDKETYESYRTEAILEML